MPMRKLIARVTALAALVLLMLATGHFACDRDESSPPVTNTTPAPSEPASKPASATSAPALKSTSFIDSFKDVTGPVKPDPRAALCIQTLALFDHPSSCAISLDGKFLFVSNSAESPSGVLYGKGSISKLAINPDGRLTMLKQDFVKGLHAPMGMAALSKATAKFPVGALFVATGMTRGIDDQDQIITDITKFQPGVKVFDPDTGNLLGFIPMGPNRAVAKSLHHPVLAPMGLCFDRDGNLFVVDGGNTGKNLNPQVFGLPGILRIRNPHLDFYAQDIEKGDIEYIPVRHVPAAVFYSKADDALYWTTSDGTPGAGGAVYRMPRKNFPQQNMAENVVGDLGALMGLAITSNGSLIASRIEGTLEYVTLKAFDTVPFYENAAFSSPGDIKILILPNGVNIVYVPEQEPSAAVPAKQRLRVILLPAFL